jgi:cell wall-associated NlpC family hydrolase
MAGLGVGLARRPRAGLVKPPQFSRRGMLGLLAGAALAGLSIVDDAEARRRRRRRSRKGGKPSKGNQIAQEARRHLNGRYVAGGTGPNSFDCSGFTSYVVKQAIGRTITPDLQGQSKVGRKVGKNRRRRGDLIFFNIGGRRVTHVAIVLSKSKVIHAMNPRDDVKISSINSSYYKSNIHSVRRL